MDTQELELLIARAMDEPLPPEDCALLEPALAESPELRARAEELARLRERCTAPVPAVDPALGSRIQSAVDRRYGRKRVRWRVGLNEILALAAGLLLVFGVSDYVAQSLSPASLGLAERAMRPFEETVLAFHSALLPLEKLAHERLAGLPNNLAEDFGKNLNLVDEAIASCEQLARTYPDSALVYGSLNRAYHAKLFLLGKILET